MNNAFEGNEEIYLVNQFVNGKETLKLGYCIPSTKADEFIEALDKAAQSVGAIPFQEIDPSDESKVTESEVLRHWIDEKDQVVQQAINILEEEN